MRRPSYALAALVALGAAVLSTGPAVGQASRDDRRGLIFDGLRKRPSGACGNALELIGRVAGARTRCTHGPDPAPPGVDVRQHRTVAATPSTPGSATFAAAQPGIPCYGNGSDGFRVQLLYARRTETTNNLASFYPNFVTWTASANMVFNASAAKTGGIRQLRLVTDASCALVVTPVEVSAAAMSDFSTFVSELEGQGLNRSDRRYLVWADANRYCGIAEVYGDDSAGATPGLTSSNANNGNPLVPGAIARVDNGCWGLANSVEAHELVHTLGGVQPTAPNATQGFHCTDDADRMCYLDGSPPGTLFQRCTATGDENRLDCNNDDYFNTSPVAGSYLATHWNVADSAFLSPSNQAGPIVVALAGDDHTEKVMGAISHAFDNTVLQVDGAPTTIRVFNIPALP